MKRHDHTKQRRRHPLATSFSFHKSAFLVILVLLSSSVVVNAAFAPSRVGSTTTATTSIMNTPLKRRNENTPSLHQLNPTPFLHTTLRGGGDLTSKTQLAMVPIFDNTPFVQSTLTFTLLNLLGFAISILSGGSHLHLDLLGTGSFAIAAYVPFLVQTAASSCTTRVSIISTGAVCVWSAKLASFLFWRALKVKTDARLEDTLSTFSGTVGFWFISALWGILTSLPHALGTTSSSPGNPFFTIIGTALFLTGFAMETTADYQKTIFKQSNPTGFCNVGLWSTSQHPNFFGNFLLWVGIFILNAPSLVVFPTESHQSVVEIMKANWRLPVAFLSPLFLWTLFSSQVNGGLTNAVELAKSKYGNDPRYVEYLEKVPKLVPNLLLLWKKD
mmetsp:Transcript_19040/g.28418  ORF Transcript_19040/g.28418 Transcript_19040/m.28418 type:complete len:387 (-) Transcript_19040:406-1566(-)